MVHENKQLDAMAVCTGEQSLLASFQEAQLLFAPARVSDTVQSWQPQEPGMYKVNFDASVRGNTVGAGIGVVIRDSNGVVVAWKRRRIKFIRCPEIAESLAAKCAVQFAGEHHFSDVIFEGDCKSVILQLQDPNPSLSPSGNIILEANLCCILLVL